ncbi:nuclear transport factor 2 family protein [Agromyces sp. LHK192]|uniref:nuclear transport factor 2 family protein n=1 Tax=Agromyces sp. LHK192 TaxID=2498704 RepID=UPI000FD89242|nr:nuclear transport factor 2 family protein [Agromyces sp. LHK192]
MSSAGAAWVEGYIRAWETNDPDDIGALFTDDAVYEYRPDDPEAARGREAIIREWIEADDQPGTWTYDWTLLVDTPELAVVVGRVEYPAEKDYDSLWVVRLEPDGRASRFTEWYMERPRD